MPDDKPFQEATRVKLKNGEEVALPRLTIGKIIAVTDAMSELIAEVKEKAPQVFDLFSGNAEGNVGVQLAQTLPQLIPVLMSKIVAVLSLYLSIPEEYIKENMDMEDLVAVATPFFVNITKQANHLLGPLSEAMKTTKKSSKS